MRADHEPLLLGVDLSTTAIKDGLHRLDGSVLGSVSAEYKLLSPSPAVVEVPAVTYWHAFTTVVHSLLRDSGADSKRIAAIGISPMLPVDMAPDANPDARGVVLGLALHHGGDHLARTLLESAAFVIRRNVEVLEELGSGGLDPRVGRQERRLEANRGRRDAPPGATHQPAGGDRRLHPCRPRRRLLRQCR